MTKSVKPKTSTSIFLFQWPTQKKRKKLQPKAKALTFAYTRDYVTKKHDLKKTDP